MEWLSLLKERNEEAKSSMEKQDGASKILATVFISWILPFSLSAIALLKLNISIGLECPTWYLPYYSSR
jgi:hypothetical protein